MHSKIIKTIFFILGVFMIAILGLILYYFLSTRMTIPEPPETTVIDDPVFSPGPDISVCGNSWLHHSRSGLWELYLEGSPYERGVLNGKLCQELLFKQEKAFVDRLEEMIPSKNYQKFLKYFVSFFNRDLDEYIKEEYQLEILGISRYASDEFNFIAPGYLRILNYHAAHDIGHALQNMNLVACTAFGVWDGKSADSSMIIGRNFDFYVGDEFAEEKIICFMKPDVGYNFMMVTWGGMIGVVSGMNEKGLTVTLNAARSSIPLSAKTPVSIVAREILQYASDIETALDIVSHRQTFVSESFLIGSAQDGKAVVIEKTGDVTAVYDPDTNHIIQTNHFQSEALFNTPLNIENMENETSVYRLERVRELLEACDILDTRQTADILRNQKGLGGKNIGMGNEKAINQLIAHHSVIFKPDSGLVWVSAGPYQLGQYLCYDLNEMFSDTARIPVNKEIYVADQTISQDTFLLSGDYSDYLVYREAETEILEAVKAEIWLGNPERFISAFIGSNPELYKTYWYSGRYYEFTGDCKNAVKYFNLALDREVGSAYERELIEKETISN